MCAVCIYDDKEMYVLGVFNAQLRVLGQCGCVEMEEQPGRKRMRTRLKRTTAHKWGILAFLIRNYTFIKTIIFLRYD